MMTAPTNSDLFRIATVIEIDLAAALVRVSVGDIESDWIDFATMRAGETKIYCPPSLGEQVFLFCPDHELEGAIILGALYSAANAAPENTKRNIITFSDGALIAYDPENHILDALLPGGGKVNLTAPADLTVNAAGGATINAQNGITINADIMLNGKLTASDDVLADGISLINHIHTRVQAGTATSGKPQ